MKHAVASDAGSTSAIATTSAGIAMTDQRTAPAAVAIVIAPVGPILSSSRGPITTDTATSAATDSHSTLAVGGALRVSSPSKARSGTSVKMSSQTSCDQPSATRSAFEYCPLRKFLMMVSRSASSAAVCTQRQGAGSQQTAAYRALIAIANLAKRPINKPSRRDSRLDSTISSCSSNSITASCHYKFE
jgi:hypothetical protein